MDEMMFQYEYHPDGTIPRHLEVFVFGSNQKGIHGAGAAKAARDHFLAEMGKGEGPTGNSYAIPTKDWNIESLPLNKIWYYVQDFLKYTWANPDKKFFVTRVGCGLAGNKDEDIAPMFKGAINCSFPEEWKQYLERQ